MKVQMFPDARSGRFSNIYTYIDALRRITLLQDSRAALQKQHEFRSFFRGKMVNVHDVTVGGDHEMPIIIGKFVHNDKIPPAAVQDKPLLVFIPVRGQAENAGIGLGSQNILQSPGAPQVFHASPARRTDRAAFLPLEKGREKPAGAAAPVFLLSIPTMRLGQVFRVSSPGNFFPARCRRNPARLSEKAVSRFFRQQLL
jgi:hypothetical protein